MKDGLSTHQVTQLLKQYGLNVISEQKKKNILIKLIEQFNNFLTILLLIAAICSFVIGEPIDGGLIFAIVILNALFGIYQEAKAEESIAALKKITLTKVRVIRDGKEQEIDSKFLVPGDIVFIEEGTKISADGQIIESINLELNESALTGESLPVVKMIKEMIYSGTIVAKGRGYMQVLKTGMQTKFGSIATNLSNIIDTKTPLQKKLEELTRLIGLFGIFIAVIVFFLSYLQNSGYFPAFLLAISLAVAVVPEGLPAVMTITLAIGVKKMAQKKAIIRKLSAIEALGSITLIATDKTGTLTTNKMKVNELYVDGKIYPNSSLPSFTNHPFSLMILNGILCSTASLVYIKDHGHFDVLGDPTEGALLYLAQDIDIVPDLERKIWATVDEKPFDSVDKIMSVLVKGDKNKPSPHNHTLHKDNPYIVFSKGAPESILVICDKIQIGKKEELLSITKKGELEKQVEKWAKKGLRVLAFAYKKNKKLDNKEMIFLGMVAIHDAPRPEVVEAVAKAKKAGIKVVMITGDNEKTAEAVGILSGIVKENDEIINGEQLDKFSDEELLIKISRVKVFARTNPFQKHRIIKLFQKLGEIVAVTGDGVNDAIALKQADVGVAMGRVGTDVARETADMVITDDNFATIVSAIEEGRNIIKNLKNAIKYLLSCNMSEAVALIVGLVMGLPTLFYAIQLLYINLITDGLPALSLAFSPKNRHVMEDKPQKDMTLLLPFDMRYIISVGVMGAILVIGGYLIYGQSISFEVGKTAAFTILALIQSFILIDLWLSHRAIHKHIKQLVSPIFISAFIFPFIAQYIIVNFPLVAVLFKITPVSNFIYFQFIVISSLILVGIKGVKYVLNKS